MNFRASFCDPFKADIVELGDVEKGKVMEMFEKVPWSEYLAKMATAKESEIYYSPSLEIENKDNRNALSISAIENQEWSIFYKRPKLVKRRKFFKVVEEIDNEYLTDIWDQTEDDVRNCLEALIRNDLQFLENKIK